MPLLGIVKLKRRLQYLFATVENNKVSIPLLTSMPTNASIEIKGLRSEGVPDFNQPYQQCGICL
jgi:hypothetical protein